MLSVGTYVRELMNVFFACRYCNDNQEQFSRPTSVGRIYSTVYALDVFNRQSWENRWRASSKLLLHAWFMELGLESLVLDPWFWRCPGLAVPGRVTSPKNRWRNRKQETGNRRTGEQEQPLARSLEQNVWSEIILNWDRTVRWQLIFEVLLVDMFQYIIWIILHVILKCKLGVGD